MRRRPFDAATASAGCLYSSFFVSIAQILPGHLVASAIAPSIAGLRPTSVTANFPAQLCGAKPAQSHIAPMTRRRQISAWPALIMRLKHFLLPEGCCLGTNPNRTAKSRPVFNCAISEPNASTATAVSGPAPGVVWSRHALSDWGPTP